MWGKRKTLPVDIKYQQVHSIWQVKTSILLYVFAVKVAIRKDGLSWGIRVHFYRTNAWWACWCASHRPISLHWSCKPIGCIIPILHLKGTWQLSQATTSKKLRLASLLPCNILKISCKPNPCCVMDGRGQGVLMKNQVSKWMDSLEQRFVRERRRRRGRKKGIAILHCGVVCQLRWQASCPHSAPG